MFRPTVCQTVAVTGTGLGVYEHLAHGTFLGFAVIFLHLLAWAMGKRKAA